MNTVVLPCSKSFQVKSLIMLHRTANLELEHNENVKEYCYCEITHYSPSLYHLLLYIYNNFHSDYLRNLDFALDLGGEILNQNY